MIQMDASISLIKTCQISSSLSLSLSLSSDWLLTAMLMGDCASQAPMPMAFAMNIVSHCQTVFR